jgi:hypothetical protein
MTLNNGFISNASSTQIGNWRVDGNATTTGSQYIGGDLTVAGTFNQSGGSSSFATTTITGDFTVQDSDGTGIIGVGNNGNTAYTLADGSGVSGSGTECGVYGYANSNTGSGVLGQNEDSDGWQF